MRSLGLGANGFWEGNLGAELPPPLGVGKFGPFELLEGGLPGSSGSNPSPGGSFDGLKFLAEGVKIELVAPPCDVALKIELVAPPCDVALKIELVAPPCDVPLCEVIEAAL